MTLTLKLFIDATSDRANDKRAVRTCTRTGTVPLSLILAIHTLKLFFYLVLSIFPNVRKQYLYILFMNFEFLLST